MWIVAKYNYNQFNTLKESVEDILGGGISYYQPKIVINLKRKKLLKNILGNYVFLKHEKFEDKNFLSNLKYIKGLSYFLPNYKFYQNQIIEFIDKCKSHECEKNILKPSFFEELINMKAKFINGPFKNLIFDIVNRNKNNFIAKINNFRITVKNKDKYFLPL